ncbi:MAG TPA: hypothetical protein VNK50_05885, partial [Calidithermus sp.]|nr:hypothetical protein [Calidithermus sp.]
FPAGTPSVFERHIDKSIGGLPLTGYPPPRLDHLRHFWASGDGRGLAEFTNRNFVSKDTAFEALEEGAVGRDRRTGHVYPSPRLRLDLRDDPDIATLPGSPHGLAGRMTFFGNDVDDRVTGDVRRNDRMVSFSLLDAFLMHRGASPLFTVNRYTVEAAAAMLLPRAVGYSAALLDHFFRGRLELGFAPEPISDDLSLLTVRNRSPEALGPGTLTLYAEAADGRRTAVPGTTLQVSGPVAPDQAITSVAVQRTLEGQRLVAVYEGRLGHEEGAVVGKVREGVEVEQIFRGANDWMLRTADGVFPLGLGSEPHIVKWGDRDNTLLTQTFLTGRDMRLQAYRINRAEGSRRVPLRPGPTPLAPPVVDLVPLGDPVTLAPRIDLGTHLTYTRTEDWVQDLLTVRASYTVEDCAIPIPLPTCSVKSKAVDGVALSTPFARLFGFTRSFPLVLDPALPADAPFSWFVTDVFLDRDGRILALVEVRLTSPLLTVPIWRRHDDGEVRPSSDQVLLPLFSPLPHVFVFVVDLTQRRVTAKSCEDAVNVTFQTATRFTAVDIVARVDGMSDPGPYVLPGTLSSTGEPISGAVIATLESTGGTTHWDLQGLHRPELRRAGFVSAPRIVSEVQTLQAALLDPFPHKADEDHILAVVQVVRTTFDVDPTDVQAIAEVVRSSGAEEGYTILGWWDSRNVERWRPVQWYPLRAQVVPLAGVSLPTDLESFVSVAGANETGALLRAEVTLQPSRERVRTTRLVTRSREIVLAGDVVGQYRLLEPHWLYGVNDQRFHRLDAGLTTLPFPRPLVAGPEFGAYHVAGGR